MTRFFLRDGTSIHTVSGQDVLDNGGQPAASGAALVKISDLPECLMK